MTTVSGQVTRIMVRTTPEGLIQPYPIITIRNAFVADSGEGGVSRLDELEDVVEEDPQDGDTLIYDADTDKYVVQPIKVSEVDGGTF